MLLELAIGDAYGSAFEFANANLKHNKALYYSKHPRHPHHPGSYTDDTQMSLAISELLLDDIDFTPINIATKFVEVFQRDPRTGYAHRFYEFLTDIESGQEFIEKMKPESEKSGAAMRAPVLGLLPDIEEVLDKTTIQAQVTHNTENGILAAKTSALLTHYFCHLHGQDNPKNQVGNWLTHMLGGSWDTPYQKNKIGTSGIDCVHAAVTAVIISNTLSEVLVNSINFTGDVDTVAAVAMGAASMCSEIENDLSPGLYYCLEETKYGRDYLLLVDTKLHRKILNKSLPNNPLNYWNS